ncbi:hypothetical protein TNCV_648691 [Trichonephila clavipes]|uniref:Endonuclease/exonuclease/phosphatase domain-containing protein n=1 Tax=Trichonephila clavipes TaxID=2585209 RepID=A0A8X6SUT7_TRICX|nr:hypothetical protein TNCV_648691 [Trichonephila clavipes]
MNDAAHKSSRTNDPSTHTLVTNLVSLVHLFTESLAWGVMWWCDMDINQCSSPVTNRGCNFSPSINSTPSINNAALVVAQSKKDHVPGLGRGPGSINNLRSPNSLKIIQFNINGISTSASRIKLDQVLDLVLTEGAQTIALQETKLKTFTSLKIKGYNIFRFDRQNRCGGGLAFLIKNINNQCVNINRKITVGSNLEIQGIRILWRGNPLNIFNMYHPPDLKSLPTDLQDLFTLGTICLGDLNAQHPIWGCSTANLRGNELLDIIDDKCFSILNDGTATHFSYSYNTKEALDISITSSDLGPCCKWTLLKNLGRDHLPILLELKKRQLVPTSLHYQKISRLNFSVEERNIKIRTSRLVHGCRSDTHRGTSMFSRDFRMNELEAAIGDSCLNKSPGPDGIHGQIIDHPGLSGRPILEYGVPVYCSASVTNLQKLEKVQLSAARIITGLKDTCPRDIVLLEADLQPLSLSRQKF